MRYISGLRNDMGAAALLVAAAIGAFPACHGEVVPSAPSNATSHTPGATADVVPVRTAELGTAAPTAPPASIELTPSAGMDLRAAESSDATSGTVRCAKGKAHVHADLSFSVGKIQPFGQQRHSCSREQGALRMDVEGRRGDYSMCCVELERPLNLSVYTLATASAHVVKPEQQLQVKLEEGPTHIRIVDAPVESNTERLEGVEFSDDERNLSPTRACLVAMGKGPAPNTVRLQSISLDGCR